MKRRPCDLKQDPADTIFVTCAALSQVVGGDVTRGVLMSASKVIGFPEGRGESWRRGGGVCQMTLVHLLCAE